MNGTTEQRRAVKARLKRMIDAAVRAHTAIDCEDVDVLGDSLEQLDQDHRALSIEIMILLADHPKEDGHG
jgi:hypothetical protein